MSMYKTPMKDQVGVDSVPTRGTKGGEYDSQEAPETPGRDGGLIPELHRDTAATSKSPSTTGIYGTLFKDAVK